MCNSLVLISFRKINVFFYLLVWLFIFAFYETSSFVVVHVVICWTFHWKYKNVIEKSITLVLVVYLQEYHKWPHIYFNSQPFPLKILDRSLEMMEQQAEFDQKGYKAPPSKRRKQHHVSPDWNNNQLTIVTTSSFSNIMDIY